MSPRKADDMVLDRYAGSQLVETAVKRGAAADKAAANTIAKYDEIVNIHISYPISIETGGAWNQNGC